MSDFCIYGFRYVRQMCEVKINEVILHNIPNGWSKQAFLQEFDFEAMIFKQSVNMFEHMDISETIYGGVVDNSTKIRIQPGQSYQ